MAPVFISTCFFILKEPGVRGREFGLRNFPSSGDALSSSELGFSFVSGDINVMVLLGTDTGTNEIGVMVKAGGDFCLDKVSDSGKESACLPATSVGV